jgi:MOSC domain-containing protein
MTKIGTIESVWRYPMKSMRGEQADCVFVSYSGLMGDRVYALTTSTGDQEFPWYTARRQENYILYKARFIRNKRTLQPAAMDVALNHPAVLHPLYPSEKTFAVEIETPEGQVFDINDPAFIESLEKKTEGKLSLHYTQRNMVDCRPVSLFSTQTVEQLRQETATNIHKLQFRANLYINWDQAGGFYEDELVGKRIKIGDRLELMILERGSRCKLLTIHPETAESDPRLLKHLIKTRKGFAGVYAAVLKEGSVCSGDEVCIVE